MAACERACVILFAQTDSKQKKKGKKKGRQTNLLNPLPETILHCYGGAPERALVPKESVPKLSTATEKAYLSACPSNIY